MDKKVFGLAGYTAANATVKVGTKAAYEPFHLTKVSDRIVTTWGKKGTK